MFGDNEYVVGFEEKISLEMWINSFVKDKVNLINDLLIFLILL